MSYTEWTRTSTAYQAYTVASQRCKAAFAEPEHHDGEAFTLGAYTWTLTRKAVGRADSGRCKWMAWPSKTSPGTVDLMAIPHFATPAEVIEWAEMESKVRPDNRPRCSCGKVATVRRARRQVCNDHFFN